jgi:parallel beta-helix repeat protein
MYAKCLVAAVLLIGVGTLLAWPAKPEEASAALPTVEFSADEGTVTIRTGIKGRELPRPVVSPWKYKAKGHTYYVAADGDDRSAGTEAKPFRTIGKGVAKAIAGDIVYVKAGTYTEVLNISHSGEEEKPIIISCAPGELGKVVLTPSKEFVEKNPKKAVITLDSGARNVWINGLVIVGPKGRPEAPKNDTFSANGITWSGKAGPGCRATNNVVCRNVHCGMKEMGHGGTKILMEGNVIFDNGTDGKDHGIYVPSDEHTLNGNIIFDTAGYAIHAYSTPKRLTITRNVCFDNKAGGIIIGGSDNKVLNNVCASNGIGIFYFRSGCKSNVVKNNIFAFNKTDCGYDNGGGKLGDPADNVDDYNCYFPGKPNKLIKPGSNEVTGADPKFVDAGKGDYRLKASSPCLGRGTDVGIPFDGKSPKLGAY